MEPEYDMDDIDDMDENEELQLALLLSMQGEDDQQGQQVGHPGAPPGGSTALQQALQQSLQAALQQLAAGAGGGAPPPQPEQVGRQAPGYAAAPAWAHLADSWLPREDPPKEVALPGAAAAAGGPLHAATEKALGCGVAYAGAGSTHAGLEPVVVRLAPGPDGLAKITPAAVKAAVAGVPAHGNLILSMQQCWLRAAEALAGQPAPEVSGVLLLWHWALAGRAASALGGDDEEDLFFEGRDESRQFTDGLEAGHVGPGFLEAMVRAAAAPEEAAVWEKVLRDAFGSLKTWDFLKPEAHAGPMRRLNVLTQSPALRRCLAAILTREARGASTISGKAFEATSILGPLLSISSLPVMPPTIMPLAFPARECFIQLRGYPRDSVGVESEYSAIRRALGGIYEIAHEVMRRIATLKPGDSPLRGREVVPAWLAAAAGLNLARAEAGSYIERVLHHRAAVQHCSGDGFLAGVLAVCLRFCRPFLATPAKKEGALQHLDPGYYVSQRHRLLGTWAERTLGGSMPPPLGEGALLPHPFLSPDRGEGEEGPHFVAEIFFLTQRLIHVGLMPTVYRISALNEALARRQRGEESDDEDGEGVPGSNKSRSSLEQHLLSDGVRAAVFDPDLANDIVQFVELEARWLLRLLRSGDEAAVRAAFALIPESAVREMAGWLSAVISYGSTELLGGMDIGALMSCMTGLLARPALVPNPLVHYAIIQLLMSMMSPQLGGRRRGRGGLARAHVTPAEAALVSAVLGSGATQTELLPALMTAYVHADHVVGLDVDKDQYDKFHMRTCIDCLLMELWRDPTCAASLSALAGAGAGAGAAAPEFSDFIGAVLNDLLYLLKDSLHRLEDIHGLEESMADEAAWAALPPRQRADKQDFYKSQQRAARGFMGQAVSALRMLNTLTADHAVQRGFLHEPVATRAATAAVHFLDLLVGPTCTRLEVQRPEQYQFDPDALLLATTHFLLRLADHPAFVAAVARVPDYEESLMRSVHAALSARGLGEFEHRRRLEALIESVGKLRGVGGARASAAGAALDLSLPGEEVEGLEAAYVAALEPLSLGQFDSAVTRAYNRHFAALAEQAAGDTSAKMKALSREFRGLAGKTSLPIHAASSIFVRHDGERMDKVRAVITGPEGTPYAFGCFAFDVFFPGDYPQVPPLMELETTGGGVARLNPNLYADGKVCLSLLGTWHGGAASEKWQPGKSSLFQVLLSIQGMIFIEDPYFNEPAYDGMRGTAEGAASSLKYNAEIWLNSIRYAMVDMIRNPRPGFEDVIAMHFRLLRHRLMRQVGDWVKQAEALDPLFQKRLADAAAELRGLLAAL